MTLTMKRPQINVDLCLDGSLRADWEAAEAELVMLQKKRFGDQRLNSAVKRQADIVLELQQQMAAETVTFTLQGVPREKWRALVMAHPEREDNATDKAYGCDIDGLTAEALPLSILKVVQHGKVIEFDPTSEWEGLVSEMTDQQYEEFFLALFRINRGRQEIPFSATASQEMRIYDEN